MALLFFDGFDHHTSDPVTVAKWGSTVSGLPMSNGTTRARTGTGGLQALGSNYHCVSKAYTTSGGCVVGFAMFFTGWGANFNLIEVREGTTVHMAVFIQASGIAQIKRGGTVIATGTTVIALNGWVYIEFKTVIDSVNGSYELRIDGIPEAALTNAGPVNTRNGGTGVWDRLYLGGQSSGTFDDFYLLDTSGAAPRNNFLGTVKVETLNAQTDAVAAGSNAGLTPSSGTDHGAMVDETPPNTSDYNSSPTVGLKDTYNYPPMTITGTVFGVQTNMYVSKSDAAARAVCHVLRTAGVDNDGPNVAPTTTFLYSSQVWAQNPNAGSPIEWTTGDIANLQAGMKVTI
jgi:hypothetical protein